jgi:hypothetical protein
VKGGIRLPVDLDVILIDLVIKIIVLAPVLWLSGRAVAGKEKAKFVDAVWIIILGALVGGIFSYFEIIGFVALLIQLLIWLGLVKHFFDTGWLKAFAISVLAIIILLIVALILDFLEIGLGIDFLWAGL